MIIWNSRYQQQTIVQRQTRMLTWNIMMLLRCQFNAQMSMWCTWYLRSFQNICLSVFIISHYENKTALVFNWVNFQIAIKLNQFKWTNLRYLVLLHGLKVLVYYLLEYFNQLFGWLDRLKFGLSFHIWYLCKPRERNNCGKREREKGVVGSHFAKYISLRFPFKFQTLVMERS